MFEIPSIEALRKEAGDEGFSVAESLLAKGWSEDRALAEGLAVEAALFRRLLARRLNLLVQKNVHENTYTRQWD